MAERNYESFDEYVKDGGATEASVREYVVGKAVIDPEFRKMLLADPRGTVAAEVGADVPETMNLTVHEETATDLHLVLPSAAEVSGDELAEIAAGCSWCPNPPRNNDSSGTGFDTVDWND